MKKLTLYIIAIILTCNVIFAQTPNAFNYQAVARTSTGEIMNEQNISIEISILESGSAIYTEEHLVTTNQFGLFSLSIGNGTPTLGSFSTINWSTGSYDMQVSMDENAGSNFVVMGTSELLTVPFAMHAKTSEDAFSGNYLDLINTPDLSDYDNNINDDFSGDYTDLTNKPILMGDVNGDINNNTVEKVQGNNISPNMPANGQVLKWDDTSMSWMPADDALGAPGSTDGVVSTIGVTGDQTKTITLNRTEGLGTLTATFTDEDTQLTESDVDAMVSNNGYLTSYTEIDGSTTNELQDLSISGTTLSIENGNSVNLAAIQDGYEPNTDTQLSEAEVDSYVANNGYLTSFTEIDGSTTNELQNLSISGTNLSIENGNSVSLAAIQDGYEANTDNQTLSLTGNNLTIANGNTINISSIDTDTQLNEAQVDAYVANNGYLTSENDGSTTNELQDLSISGTTLSIENGNSVSLAAIQDGYEANTDNQTLSLTGNNLTIANGNTVNISSIDTDTQLNEAQVDAYVANNGYLTSENDGSTTNELQDLSISGTTLSIENGNSVDLSSISGGGAFSTTSNITSNVNGDTSNDDFVFGSSNYYSGGNKMYFEKSKGAFRMGDYTGTAWSSSNIGTNSTAMGYNAKAKGDYSAAFGYEVSALEYASFVIGRYNIESAGLSDTWNDLLPLFVIGNGSSNIDRNNALTVLKSGNVGIGVAAPDDALDVSGNLHVQNGTFQYEDGNEASGKVLMSNYNGTASWESLPQNLEQVIHPINGVANQRQITGINSTSQTMGSSYSVTKNLASTTLEIEVMGYIMIENYNLADWIFIDLEFTGAAGAADHGIKRIYIPGADASESATVYIPVHFKAYWSSLSGGTYNLVFKARTSSQTDSDAVLTMLVNGFGQLITAKEFQGN